MSNVKIITKLLYISKVKGEAVISESSNYLDYMKKGGILEKIDDDQLRDQNGEVSMDFNGSKSARLEDFVSEIEERTKKRLEIFKDPYKKFEDIQNQEIMKYCKEMEYNPQLAKPDIINISQDEKDHPVFLLISMKTQTK
jgi:vacuolar-type H+-ATPase subunit I/STV1